MLLSALDRRQPCFRCSLQRRLRFLAGWMDLSSALSSMAKETTDPVRDLALFRSNTSVPHFCCNLLSSYTRPLETKLHNTAPLHKISQSQFEIITYIILLALTRFCSAYAFGKRRCLYASFLDDIVFFFPDLAHLLLTSPSLVWPSERVYWHCPPAPLVCGGQCASFL